MPEKYNKALWTNLYRNDSENPKAPDVGGNVRLEDDADVDRVRELLLRMLEGDESVKMRASGWVGSSYTNLRIQLVDQSADGTGGGGGGGNPMAAPAQEPDDDDDVPF